MSSALTEAAGSRPASKHIAPKLLRRHGLFLNLTGRAILMLLYVANVFSPRRRKPVERAHLLVHPFIIFIKLRYQVIQRPLSRMVRGRSLEISRGFEKLLGNLGHRRKRLYLINLHLLVRRSRVQS